MATKKKAKKKAIRKTAPRSGAAIRAKYALPAYAEYLTHITEYTDKVFDLVMAIHRQNATILTEMTATREAVERLDLTVGRGLASVARGAPIDRSLYPGPSDGGVPERVAMLDADEREPDAMLQYPTTAERLAALEVSLMTPLGGDAQAPTLDCQTHSAHLGLCGEQLAKEDIAAFALECPSDEELLS